MDNDAKLRPWILARILYERTDYDHSLTTAQLMKILEDEFGMPTHRTTVTSDIEMLQSLGMDIQLTKTQHFNEYNVLSRYFEDAELKLMIDAVASSRFITASQSKKIIEKISAMAGKNAADRMVRNVSVEHRIKGSNKKVMGIVDVVNEAITQEKQISFQYFEYNVKKERKLRFDGYWYKFSPWRLVWNGDFYYIVGWYEKYNKVMNYRVDRIAASPKILEEDALPMPKGFDFDRYLNTMYHMFSSERQTVMLICDNSLMDAIIDRFGENVVTYAYDMQNFRVDVEVAVNSVFFSWIVGFGGLVKIKYPDDVKAEYAKFVTKAYDALDKPKEDKDDDLPF